MSAEFEVVSDFLSHLLERATGEAPVLEYRRASLFEPVTKTMHFDELEPHLEFVETQTERPGARNKRSSAPAESELNERSTPKGRVAPTAQSTVQEEKAPATQNALVAHPKPAPEPGERLLSTIVDRAKPSSSEKVTAPARETQQTIVKEVTVPERVVETRLDREIILVAGRENRERPVIEKARPPEVVQPSVQLIKPKVSPAKTDTAISKPKINTQSESSALPARRSSIKPAEIPRPFSAPLVNPARRSAKTQAPLPPPAPTVQVTIGRVEVRATPAPPVKHQATRVAPKLTLDEYLRSRSGGRA